MDSSNERKFECDICGKRLKTRKILKCHSQTHKKEKPKCEICNIEFRKGIASLNRHNVLFHGDRPFKCDICAKSFKVKSSIKVHRKLHTEPKQFKCNLCDKKFSQKGNVDIHMRIHTNEKQKSLFKCEICQRSFPSKSASEKHARIHTGEKPFGCDLCGDRFTDNVKLKKHNTIYHYEIDSEDYKCEICGKQFPFRAYLEKHAILHEEKTLQCILCERMFRHKVTLKTHMQTHAGERNYKCETCGKSFVHANSLRKHKTLHSNEKPFQCDLCGMKFRLKSFLTKHTLEYRINVQDEINVQGLKTYITKGVRDLKSQ